MNDSLPFYLAQQRLITRAQLREILPVSAMTVWRWEQDGRLPRHFTIGRRSFWKLDDVLRALSDAQASRVRQ